MISIPHIPRYFNCIALSCFALFCIALQSFGTKLYIRLGLKIAGVPLQRRSCTLKAQFCCKWPIALYICAIVSNTHIYIQLRCTPEEQLCYILKVQLLCLVDVQLICNCFTLCIQVCNGKIVLYYIYTIVQLCCTIYVQLCCTMEAGRRQLRESCCRCKCPQSSATTSAMQTIAIE